MQSKLSEMMNQTDDEILVRIGKGEINAYAILVDRYQDKAYALALSMLGNRNTAEEAVHDSFVRAYRALERFQKQASFSTWLYRIVYNQCISISRKRKTNQERYSELPDEDIIPGSFPNPEQELEKDEFQVLVEKEIRNLPEHYRTLMLMFLLQDLSYQEIVGVTGLPLGTVKTRLHRARQLLRLNVIKYYNTTGSRLIIQGSSTE
jgi:RNA polymerase sigma-70 factor, ECF subfamily